MQALETAIVQKSLVTDEASALELLDIPVKLLLGRTDNLKINLSRRFGIGGFHFNRISSRQYSIKQ